MLKYSHRDFRSSLAHEYFSFAHFIDIVSVVQITFIDGIFNVVVFDEDEMLRGFHKDKWLIQNEFVDNFSFKISSPPPAHRIFGFNLFARSCKTSEYSHNDPFYIEIRNNTSGRSLLCTRYKHEYDVKFQSLMHVKSRFGCPLGNVVLQSLSHWKLGGDNPTFQCVRMIQLFK